MGPTRAVRIADITRGPCRTGGRSGDPEEGGRRPRRRRWEHLAVLSVNEGEEGNGIPEERGAGCWENPKWTFRNWGAGGEEKQDGKGEFQAPARRPARCGEAPSNRGHMGAVLASGGVGVVPPEL